MHKKTIFFLNYLKVALILLVVAHHSALAYTVGESWPIINSEKTKVLAPMLTINASFFMSLFFLISAYFIPSSYKKYGLRKFLLKKIVHLLIPAFIISVFVLPPTFFYLQNDYTSFIKFCLNHHFTVEHFHIGHMWFLVQLFFLCVVYSFYKTIQKDHFRLPLKNLSILFFICYSIFISIFTFFVAQYSPINKWYFFHSVEPFHFVQYVFLFYLGILIKETDSLSLISRKHLLPAGIITLLLVASIFILPIYYQKLPLSIFSFWTGLMSVWVCIFSIALFSLYNQSNRFLSFLSENSYGIYLFHIPVVVYINYYLLDFSFDPFYKFVITTITVYLFSLIISWGLRRIKLVRSII